MHGLRCEREAFERRGILELEGDALKHRKGRLRILSTQFPGALRELEYFDADALEQRIARCRAVIGGKQDAVHWVLAVDRYHLCWTQTLAARLQKKHGVRAIAALGSEGPYRRAAAIDLGELLPEELESIALRRGPQILEAVAGDLGSSTDDLSYLLFGQAF